MDLRVLHDIAEYVRMDDMASLIDEISVRSQQANCDLILPLVGEFSSGKTTLINALTDSKKLETATKPTTATIYRIHLDVTNLMLMYWIRTENGLNILILQN